MRSRECCELRAEGRAQLCLEAAAHAQEPACKAWALACLNR